MTEHEHYQSIRRNLMEQFNKMRDAEITPIPEEFRHLVPQDRWSDGF